MSVLLTEARSLTNRLGQIVSAVQDIVDDAVDEPTSDEQEINGAAGNPTDKRGSA